MTDTAIARPRARRKTRAEKAQATYQNLMDAAAKVVGEEGYAAASITKITAQAKVAHGTFYNYFQDRQDLFDKLLPYVGRQLTDRIVEDVKGVGDSLAREVARFRSYCDYLCEYPGFYRVLYEAEVFAPKAHAEHMKRLTEGYRRALDRAVAKGDITGYQDQEIDALAWMMLGVRAYIAMRYFSAGSKSISIPESVISAYEKLLKNGMFSAP
ncbi:MAG: TetR/AcrR family transcriptional regulator [Pseudomonadota bacterium]|nr:TetR/AcrR family transcriptional regulator [Pseudomonadota bacterium]